MKNAEYEVIQRVVSAGMNIGAKVIVIDNDGYPLWASDSIVSNASERITAADCCFAISLHFKSPKVIDVPSYAALWNPPKFYELFGYQYSVQELASHDDLLSCGSNIADPHALNLFEGYGRLLPLPLPTLYHSVPASFLEPSIDEGARLFYIGINWERITGQKGRHHDLLQRLDAADLIDIYGPEVFHGVQPWEGFRNYRGSIPFDGRSILADINRAGVCLAFSSEEHQKSGIMSTRLFEGLAAGAAVIANPHPLIERDFSDCVYVVDDTKGPQDLARDVKALLLDIRRNPDEALRRARIGQARLKERFTLEQSLTTLFDVHAGRAAERSGLLGRARPEIDVLVCYSEKDAEILIDLVRMAVEQVGVAVHVSLLCDEALYASCGDAVRRVASGAASFRTVLGELHLRPLDLGVLPRRRKPMGELVATAFEGLASPLFCMIMPGDSWFSDHLARLASALDRTPEAYLAASGSIFEDPGEGRRSKRTFETLIFDQAWRILHAVDMPGPGRFLFRASLLPRLPRHLIRCLDGLEHRALALRGYLDGPMAQSGAATYLNDRRPSRRSSPSDELVTQALQVSMIMDSVRADPVWLARIPHLRIPPVEPASFLAEVEVPKEKIEIDTPILLTNGGRGAALLAEGFSTPEDSLTWIDGRAGSIRFTLPDDVESYLVTLVLAIGARKSRKSGEDQACTIKVNGQTVIDQEPVGEERQLVRIPLSDVESLEDGEEITLEIRLRHADRVFNEKGRVIDSRRLGLWVRSLELQLARAPIDYPLVEPNTAYEMIDGGRGREILGPGFSAPERYGTWVDGNVAQLNFRLPPDVDSAGSTLRITLSGRKSHETGQDQVATFRINKGSALKDVTILEEEQILDLPLTGYGHTGSLNAFCVDIKLQHAERVYDHERIVDRRHLGMRLAALEIVDRRGS